MDATERRLARREREKKAKAKFRRGHTFHQANADAVRRVDKGDCIYYVFSKDGEITVVVRVR